MKILQVHNVTRFRGGGDRVFELTVAGLRAREDVEVITFVKDSAELAVGLRGKVGAALNGVRAPRAVLREFEAVVERDRPDVVHVHELYPYITPWALVACSERGIPVVMSCHEFRLTCPVGTHLRDGVGCRLCLDGPSSWPCATHNCRGRRSESLAFALRHGKARKTEVFKKHVGCFLAASDFMRRHLEAAGFGPVRHVPFPIVIHEGESSDGESKGGFEEGVDGEYAAFVGRFVPEKGIHTLLEAARVTGIPVKLAGRVGDLPLDLPPNAACVGELRGADLAAFYRGARFLVVPSEWDEPYGLVAGEAQLHGRPVIATRVGGLQELVSEGETGLLVGPGDPAALAAAIKTLWSDPERCRRLGATGRSRIDATASLPVHSARLVDLYRELL